MPSPDLAAIEARAAAATEGPWEWVADDHGRKGIDHSVWSSAAEWYVAQLVTQQADAAFIAHARTDVPALVAAVRERDILIAAAERIVGEQDARIRELEAENAKIDDLDEALRQRDREILGLRRDRDARDVRIAELEAIVTNLRTRIAMWHGRNATLEATISGLQYQLEDRDRPGGEE